VRRIAGAFRTTLRSSPRPPNNSAHGPPRPPRHVNLKLCTGCTGSGAQTSSSNKSGTAGTIPTRRAHRHPERRKRPHNAPAYGGSGKNPDKGPRITLYPTLPEGAPYWEGRVESIPEKNSEDYNGERVTSNRNQEDAKQQCATPVDRRPLNIPTPTRVGSRNRARSSTDSRHKLYSLQHHSAYFFLNRKPNSRRGA